MEVGAFGECLVSRIVFEKEFDVTLTFVALQEFTFRGWRGFEVSCNLLVVVVHVLKDVFVTIQVEIKLVIQHQWQVVEDKLSIVIVPLSPERMVLDSCLPNNGSVAVPSLHSFLHPIILSVSHFLCLRIACEFF